MLLVENIRPENRDLKKIREEAGAADRQWLLQREASFVHVPCPACQQKKEIGHFKKNGFGFCKCANCDTLYMPLRPNAKTLGLFYEQSALMNFFGKYIFPASQNFREERIYKPRLERMLGYCNQFGIRKDSYLEVGAGSGLFTQIVAQSNYFSKVTALEPSLSLAKQCQARGLKVIPTAVEDVDLSVQADVVASYEVIEHLFSPQDFLKQVAKLLNPGGLCFITCPNSLSFEVLALGKNSTTIGATHLTLFNPKSISILFEACGLKVLNIATPGLLDVSLVKKGIEQGASINSTFLEHVLETAPEQFQSFLQENNLSSHMWVVASKPIN